MKDDVNEYFTVTDGHPLKDRSKEKQLILWQLFIRAHSRIYSKFTAFTTFINFSPLIIIIKAVTNYRSHREALKCTRIFSY